MGETEDRVGGSWSSAPTDAPVIDQETLRRTSSPFVGRWHQLISQTNWEKGRIISHWRQRLMEAQLPVEAYSDETWSRLVGGISPQHAGRLRRTFDRFGEQWQSYQGLYWSHFYAALDWDDAELWLEGAAQNGWSVAHMRWQRWESLGSIAADRPRAEAIVDVEIDEEAASLSAGVDETDRIREATADSSSGPLLEGPDFGEELPGDPSAGDVPFTANAAAATTPADGVLAEECDPLPLFEAFTGLPPDVDQAVEAMKLAIIRHKAACWHDISEETMIRVLQALIHLVRPTPRDDQDDSE